MTQKTSKIVTDTSKNNGSFKSLFRSLLSHPYHYANDSVSVKPLSLICITSDLFEGYFPPSEAEKSIFLLFDKTEFKHLTLPFTHSEIVNFMEDLAVITAPKPFVSFEKNFVKFMGKIKMLFTSLGRSVFGKTSFFSTA